MNQSRISTGWTDIKTPNSRKRRLSNDEKLRLFEGEETGIRKFAGLSVIVGGGTHSVFRALAFNSTERNAVNSRSPPAERQKCE